MTDETKENQALTVEDVISDLQRDLLTMPDELVREALAEHGLEPEDPKPLEHLKSLLRQHKRASLRAAAEAKKQQGQNVLGGSGDWLRRRTQELLDAGHPGLRMAARGRSAEAMTDDELRSIAEDLALAELFEEQPDE